MTHRQDSRDEAGVIATLSDGMVVYFGGATKKAVSNVADYCDEHGLRIVTLSTPRTIMRDLAGSRVERKRGRTSVLRLPEPDLLGQIGRGDLLTKGRR
jgi:hypothetical protein